VADKTPSSPDSLQIRSAPLSSARLSKKAAFAAIAVVAVILGVIIMNVSRQKPQKANEEATKQLEPALGAAQNLTRDIPDDLAAPKQVQPSVPALPSTPARTVAVKSSADEARLADTAVPKFSGAEESAGASMTAEVPAAPASPAQGGNSNGSLTRLSNGLPSLPGITDQASANQPDLNHQDQKLAFLEKTHATPYLNSRLAAPLSPFEVKTGTVIPGVLVSELNSDLPGEIIAQVSQNVYDTASGNHLLIPQGTKLFGHYDSQVTFGQDRVQVSWQRLIYPNADTLELAGMAGHDQGGNAGFGDIVDQHLGRIFGWGLLTSVLSAGYQLSQPQQAQSLVPSNQQVAAAAVGQQMAQLGASIAARNMQVQPTIRIRKGYRLNVMVNKDIVFPGSYEP
jgi:type IV secretory pathway VirB10-like protein